ncbi:MAG: glycoside hydrolase family 97 catalytic domain-containing protein [Dysgonamonadaceae bacterium]|jgi:alpha-glucosidase|nr:glycoside hydrolase family 97 catalytic domain-containing protein [Dysgonamonadaceae bacterium]
MKKYIYCIVLLLYLISCGNSLSQNEEQGNGGYLFAHMTNESYGSMFYSISRDGLDWMKLNNGEKISGYRGHPDFCKGKDGRYYMIGIDEYKFQPVLWVTSSLTSWEIEKWLSRNIFDVSEMDYKTDINWYGAPKMYYDEDSKQYIITWHAAHKNFSANGNEEHDKPLWRSMRTFYILTSDFETFTKPQRLFNFTGRYENMATLDVIIRKIDGEYYAFIKDERWQEDINEGYKAIHIAKSSNLTGHYANPGPAVTDAWHEAQTLARNPDDTGWYLFAENYPNKYDLYESASIEGTWQKKTTNAANIRHGSVIRIDEAVYQSLLNTFTEISATDKPVEIASPDGKNKVIITTGKQVSYSVFRNGETILTDSRLTLTAGNHTWGKDTKPSKIERRQVNDAVQFTVPRKYRSTQNHYNEVSLQYEGYRIEFRVYDNGVAYRFVSLTDNPAAVKNELVEYRFDKDYNSYTLLTNKLENWYEENYTVKPLESLPRDSFSIIPVMVEAGKYTVLLAEANLYHYAGMYLQPDGKTFKGVFANYPEKEEIKENGNKLYATERHDYIIPQVQQRAFPWRVMGIFDQAIDILGNELIYLLSDEQPATADYSWIKPGKVLWDWWNDRNIYQVNFQSGINTATCLYMVDYAAGHGIEYILIDEGWTNNDDLFDHNPQVDLPTICKYAVQKGVGVQLWIKWMTADKQMDKAFPLFRKWGIKGVKIDFMDRNDAKMVDFYRRVAVKAAENKLLVDFHGSYPNEGMRRQYPNLMTREGVIGLEYNKWSNKATVTHDLIIPYLRMWAGPMDYTPGAMLNAHSDVFYANQREPMSQGTRSHQVAMYIVYESPLQMLSDSPSKYDANPESFEFIKQIPTVWDETVPLAGEIGKYIVVARRSGNTWYIGAMNGETSREVEVDLSFLGDGKKRVKSHIDGINADYQAKDYAIGEISVSRKLKIKMARGGGYAGIVLN